MFIKIRVYPGSKKDEIIQKSEDNFEIKVKEKAKLGQANRAVLWLLSLHFGIPKNKINIIKGWRQGNKIIEIRNEK